MAIYAIFETRQEHVENTTTTEPQQVPKWHKIRSQTWVIRAFTSNFWEISVREEQIQGFLTLFGVDFFLPADKLTPFRVVLRFDVMNETYGRGQLEWALWRSFARAHYNTSDVPRVFRTRIKRLLDIDRELKLDDAEIPPQAPYAFAAPPDVEGSESEYKAVDGFCLAIALDLLDTGFKQSEIVFLMRYLRSELEERFPALLGPPSLIDRQRHLAEDHSDFPTYEYQGHHYVDRRLFMLLQKVELIEIIPGTPPSRPQEPVIYEPVFCEGIEALKEKLHEIMPDHRRAVTVLELAATAQAVQLWLTKAPMIRRGRPKS